MLQIRLLPPNIYKDAVRGSPPAIHPLKTTNEMAYQIALEPLDVREIAALPVLKKHDRRPFFTGGGSEDLFCGNCHWLLAQSVSRRALPRAAMLCPYCNRYNRLAAYGRGGNRE